MLLDALSLFEERKDIEGLSGVLRRMSELAEFLAELGKDQLLTVVDSRTNVLGAPAVSL